MNKICPSIEDAVAGIEDGMDVMIGGFGGAGAPIELIEPSSIPPRVDRSAKMERRRIRSVARHVTRRMDTIPSEHCP
jgi:hypothetical protein